MSCVAHWIVLLVLGTYTALAVSQESSFTQAVNCFTINLMKRLTKQPDGNLIMSGLSADVVLTMIEMGARGKTAEELAKALQITEYKLTDAAVKDAFKSTLEQLSQTKNVTLTIADSIWIDKKFSVSEDYKKMVKETFDAQEKSVNFEGDASGATDQINQWAKEQTNSLIEKLFDKPLPTETKLVLANALYFKGVWEHKFDKSLTKDLPFHNQGDSQQAVSVPQMYQFRHFLFRKDTNLGSKVLQMDYQGGETAFVAVLPNQKQSYQDVEDKMICSSIGSLLRPTNSVKVKVTLPRFDIASDLNLKQPLTELGVTTAFEDNADLTGITGSGTPGVKVTGIVQKARVKVNEEGSEAAAVTGGVVGTTSIEPEEIGEFNANRPFYMFIMHKPTGMILFAGKINKLQ